MEKEPSSGTGTLADRLKNHLAFLTALSALITPIAGGIFSYYQWQTNTKFDIALKTAAANWEDSLHRRTIAGEMTALIEKAKSNLNLSAAEEMRVELANLKIRIDAAKYKNEEDARFDGTRSMPFFLSLLKEQDEMLVDIGGTPADIDFWLPIVIRSGDPKIKKTGIRALSLVISTSKDKATRIHAINSLIEIERAIDFQQIVTETSQEIAQLFHNKYQDIILRFNAQDAVIDADWKVILADLTRRKEALSTRVAAFDKPPIIDASGKIMPAANGPASKPADQRATAGRDLNEATVRQNLNKVANLVILSPKEVNTSKIKEIIEDFESTDSEKRDEARILIGQIGSNAVPLLFDQLAKPSPSYRTKLGVIASLAKMDPDLDLSTRSADDLRKIANLLSDSDDTIKGNAAIFLRTRTNIKTIEWAEAGLWEALDKQTDDYWASSIVRIIRNWYEEDRQKYPNAAVSKAILAKLSERKSKFTADSKWLQTYGYISNTYELIKRAIER